MAEPYDEKKDVEGGQVVTDVLGISGEEGGFQTPGTLQRRMKNRHIAMISLGGVIGTGLFLNAATGLMNGGPAGLLLAYLFCSTPALGVMLCLGEMVTLFPIQGGHVKLAERFVGKSWSFALGWLYWLNWALVFPAEIIAVGVIIRFWDKETNSTVYIMVAWIVVMMLNSFGAGIYGESEFWFASIKMITIVGIIILGIIVDAGGGPQGEAIGFRYWNNPGAFNQFLDIEGTLGRFLGFWSCLVQASGAFIGFEIVALAAAESKNPRRNVPRAVKKVYIRICLFYIISSLIAGMLVSQDDEALNLGDSTAASSPFVIAFSRAGISVVPSLVNACLVTAAWSAGNADVYTSSRALYGLAAAGNAPAIFLKTTRAGVPWVALIPSGLIGLLGLTALKSSAGTIFNYFVNLTSTAGLMCWFAIAVVYVRFNAGWKAQGHSRKDLPYHNRLAPFAGWYTLVVTFIICFFSGFKNFIGDNWDAPTFVTNYLPMPLIFILFLVHKFTTGAPVLAVEDMDFVTGLAEFDAQQLRDEEAERQAYSKMGRIGRFWDRLM
ncbi:amino acid transporter [Peniophora sp. CONT]|nr:amino acid transporter [Peniophora sp. CONT]